MGVNVLVNCFVAVRVGVEDGKEVLVDMRVEVQVAVGEPESWPVPTGSSPHAKDPFRYMVMWFQAVKVNPAGLYEKSFASV